MDPEGGQGVQNPLENHKAIGFLSNTGSDPLENHKDTKPTDDGLLLVVIGSFLPSSTKKNPVRVELDPL